MNMGLLLNLSDNYLKKLKVFRSVLKCLVSQKERLAVTSRQSKYIARQDVCAHTPASLMEDKAQELPVSRQRLMSVNSPGC